MSFSAPDHADTPQSMVAFPKEFARNVALISALTRKLEERRLREQAAIDDILRTIDKHSKNHDSTVGIFPNPHNP